MTLSRQLMMLISCMFLLIFAGTFWISVQNTRSYLMLQMQVQTQNVADSFGLSLASYMQAKDMAAIDTMVNAVFDSGYYKSLTLTNMSGKTLIERENTSKIDGVPQWFIENLSLQTPKIESVITTGWRQAGKLEFVAHPGFAYKKLWQTTQQTFWWSIVAFIASLIAVILILKTILRPLHAVEDQAVAISNREFPIQENIPRTRELKRVVTAMNRMSKTLREFIQKLTERAEKMRQEAYVDALTSLRNRRAFDATLEYAMHDKENGGNGFLAVLRISGFATYNKQEGIQAGDRLLLDVSRRLALIAQDYSNSEVFRITGTDFAIILPQVDYDIADTFAKRVSQVMERLAASLSLQELSCMGISLFHEDSQYGEVLADADAALASAQSIGANSYVIQSKKSEALGNIAWQKLIESSMDSEDIRLLTQIVCNQQGDVVYKEVLMRIGEKAGDLISPGVFVSMAERLDLSQQLDQFIMEKVVKVIEESGYKLEPLAINLSANAIGSRTFYVWLEQFFKEHVGVGKHLMFEMSEASLLRDLDSAKALIELLHVQQCKVIMERFGSHLSSFQMLHQLKVDFIKISGSYTRNIVQNKDNRFFLQVVADLTHGLAIDLIAEQVESEEEAHTMQELGVKMLQGYYLGKPEVIG